MATYTENYNLEKPAQSDLYNIDVFNENADKIDEALGDKAENQSLAPIESSATASRNYSIGQQFVYNGLLYEATSAIASGGTITPGTNCARTTVAEELKSLNDSLTNLNSVITGTPTYKNSWSNNGLMLFKIGRLCVLHLAIRNGTSLSEVITLPQGFRPASNASFFVSDLTNKSYGFAYITASTGNISLNGITLSSGSNNIICDAVYYV